MALGGGKFLTQNKVLPGAYINFISAAKASANLADRGTCTMAFEMDWGKDGEIIEVTNEDFIKNSKKIFGYDFADEKMKNLRDLFINAKKLYAYRLNSGNKATCEYADAKYSGIRGNDLKVVVQKNIDDESKYNISTLLDDKVVDTQIVATKEELKDNDYLDFKSDINITKLTSGTSLAGGINGTVTAGNHQDYLTKVESYPFNVIGLLSKDTPVKKLYEAFTKRLRDEVGQKFQAVIHDYKADYEGIINVKNVTKDGGTELVYWVTGLEASTNINKSCLNKRYDGELDIVTEFSQGELKKAILHGEFALHNVGDDVRVLSDINSLTTVTDEKGEVFKDNQTIRVIDQIAMDIAHLFNTKYLGNVPNDKAGRTSLWSDIVKYHETLQDLRAIENFKDEDIVVEQGDDKKAVLISDYITVVNTMAKLYMVVKVA